MTFKCHSNVTNYYWNDTYMLPFNISLKEYKNIKINMKLYLMNVEYGNSLLILFLNMVRFLSENI